MNEQIRQEVRIALLELSENSESELLRLRALHYNIHHIIFNPIEDKSPMEIVDEIKQLLSDFDW